MKHADLGVNETVVVVEVKIPRWATPPAGNFFGLPADPELELGAKMLNKNAGFLLDTAW